MTTATDNSVTTTAMDSYIDVLVARLTDLVPQQQAQIDAAAEAMAATIHADGLVHIFGTGHSHIMAAEAFYRAGGLGAINPILLEGLLLHSGVELATAFERTAGLGQVVFDRINAGPSDTLIVISNSGSNVIARELTLLCQGIGMTVIGITSLLHARSADSRGAAAPRIDELADIVLDNLGQVGDASTAIEGFDILMGPTSTVVGAALMNGLAMTTAEKLIARGEVPMVFSSGNVMRGQERNLEIMAKYRPRVKSM